MVLIVNVKHEHEQRAPRRASGRIGSNTGAQRCRSNSASVDVAVRGRASSRAHDKPPASLAGVKQELTRSPCPRMRLCALFDTCHIRLRTPCCIVVLLLSPGARESSHQDDALNERNASTVIVESSAFRVASRFESAQLH